MVGNGFGIGLEDVFDGGKADGAVRKIEVGNADRNDLPFSEQPGEGAPSGRVEQGVIGRVEVVTQFSEKGWVKESLGGRQRCDGGRTSQHQGGVASQVRRQT